VRFRLPRIPDKTFSVWVMSDAGANVRKYQVTGRALRFALGGAGALVVLLIGAVVAAYFLGSRWSSEAERIDQVVQENQELREKLHEAHAEVRQVQSKVTSIGGELEKVSKYAQRLRRFTSLSDPSRNLAIGPVLGADDPEESVGAPEGLGEEDGTTPRAREERQMRLGLAGRRLGRIEAQAAETQRNLETLEKHFKDREVILTSTPSIWPTRGVFASGFGMRRDPIIGVYSFHKGIDIFADTGSPIIAPANGTVIFAANKGGYGLHVILDHGFGLKTRFAHMSKVEVEVGQRVQRGQRLGLVGSTGRSTGPHLHYEVILNGVPQNPFRYILDD
jgi:murein DD-endopeptidase MepM/ murein hydrolase activator NlpD